MCELYLSKKCVSVICRSTACGYCNAESADVSPVAPPARYAAVLCVTQCTMHDGWRTAVFRSKPHLERRWSDCRFILILSEYLSELTVDLFVCRRVVCYEFCISCLLTHAITRIIYIKTVPSFFTPHVYTFQPWKCLLADMHVQYSASRVAIYITLRTA